MNSRSTLGTKTEYHFGQLISSVTRTCVRRAKDWAMKCSVASGSIQELQQAVPTRAARIHKSGDVGVRVERLKTCMRQPAVNISGDRDIGAKVLGRTTPLAMPWGSYTWKFAEP